jgi:hypothetical protein
MSPRLTENEGKLTHDAPGWDLRSALTIKAGRWRMRNGDVALVSKLINLAYESASFKGKRDFPVWKGSLECCGTPMTWNVNGTYAAVGKHEFDLLARAQAR